MRVTAAVIVQRQAVSISADFWSKNFGIVPSNRPRILVPIIRVYMLLPIWAYSAFSTSAGSAYFAVGQCLWIL